MPFLMTMPDHRFEAFKREVDRARDEREQVFAEAQRDLNRGASPHSVADRLGISVDELQEHCAPPD